MDLTPDEHRKVRADAFLMWRRWLANPYTPVTAQTADERPSPPDPNAVHEHRKGYHYRVRPTHPTPKGGAR